MVDALVKVVSSREPVPIDIFTSDQHKPSVRYEEPKQAGDGLPTMGLGANQSSAPSDPEVMELDEDPAMEPDPLADWRTSYLDYLLHEVLPTDKMEARWLARRVNSFILVEGKLYKRSHTRIL